MMQPCEAQLRPHEAMQMYPHKAMQKQRREATMITYRTTRVPYLSSVARQPVRRSAVRLRTDVFDPEQLLPCDGLLALPCTFD